MAIIDELKQRYNAGSMLMRIIYINIAVFVVLRLIGVLAAMFNPGLITLLRWVEVSSNPWEVLHKPWTVLTYAFAHYEILHIFFNMLWLYWLGRIFMEYFTSKQLAGLYILGALGGAALYLVCYTWVPMLAAQPAYMLGASASVLAIVMAMAVYNPNYKIGLLFIGDVSLKWIALVTVFIDLMGIEGANAGGHIAHLGGALVGVLYAVMMRRGHDITRPLNACIDKVYSWFARKEKVKGPGNPIGGKAYRGNRQNTSTNSTQQGPTEADLDRVLAKIKRSGYTALTDEERDLLFSFGKKK